MAAAGRLRGRGTGQETFHKFAVTNDYVSKKENDMMGGDDEQKEDMEPVTILKDEDDEIECEDCFVEQLFKELLLHGVDLEISNQLWKIVFDEQYDTDAVV